MCEALEADTMSNRGTTIPYRPKVLVLSRNYPNNVFEILGLWVERQVCHSTLFCEPKVIAPVQYVPSLPGLSEYYARFRQINSHQWMSGVEVFRPRYLVGPGYSLHNFEWMTYYLSVRGQVERLHKTFPFALIHAHFTYPDGVVAARLGRRYNVPVIITEQVPWRPWLDNYPLVRKQAVWAARASAFHIAISNSVRESIEPFTGKMENLRVIPDGVDGNVFTLRQTRSERLSNQILFVGVVRPVKGLDILLDALRLLIERGHDVKLVIAGESYYQSYRREYDRLRQLVQGWNLGERIQFVGKISDAELVALMQSSALLVLPSRAESLGVVLIEALACGTPVVATRCGGPEDIVNEKVGMLVPPENPEALARGIEQVLGRISEYDPAELRAYALEHFGLESVGQRIAALYAQALGAVP
jgi:teichuronic acid biosynthesis glycosyltransferase TuaC